MNQAVLPNTHTKRNIEKTNCFIVLAALLNGECVCDGNYILTLQVFSRQSITQANCVITGKQAACHPQHQGRPHLALPHCHHRQNPHRPRQPPPLLPALARRRCCFGSLGTAHHNRPMLVLVTSLQPACGTCKAEVTPRLAEVTMASKQQAFPQMAVFQSCCRMVVGSSPRQCSAFWVQRLQCLRFSLKRCKLV